MRKLLFLLFGLGAYFAPEAMPRDTLVRQIEWVLREVTYDSVVAWILVLTRRFVLISAPQYLMLWFLRPLAPRWVRKRVDALSKQVGQYGRAFWLLLKTRLNILVSTPFRILLSLTFSVSLFVVVHHYFGHFVIVIIGFWPLVRPYVLYGLRSTQHFLFRSVAFLGLQKLVPPVLQRVPKYVYSWVYGRLHGVYRYLLRLQISWRLRIGRELERLWKAVISEPAGE